MSLALYSKTCVGLSKQLTHQYSTSFSMGIRMIHKEYRWAIYSIYGFVRLADEIVDTFYGQNQKVLLNEFKADTYKAIANKLSINPVLHAFQQAALQFNIDKELIEPFFVSMEMDLDSTSFDTETYENYIYGSAEVVGLMCLKVFCNGDNTLYEELKAPAKSLGSAFQKVNFLRDIQDDFENRGRTYFPDINFANFTEADKQFIIKDIEKDFEESYIGIMKLPLNCKFGVYTAYRYYIRLLYKISKRPVQHILKNRVRVPDFEKIGLLIQSFLFAKTCKYKSFE